MTSLIFLANKTTKLRWFDKLTFEFNNYGSAHSYWWLYMHNPYDMPASIEWNAIPLAMNNLYQVTWSLNSFSLLEAPYRTNCRNYRKSSEHLSRRDCIRKCKLNTSVDKCGVILEGIDIRKGEPSVLFGSADDKQCVEKIDFETICRKECSHYDCLIDYYQPAQVNYYPFSKTYLVLVSPTKPETKFYHEPKLEPVEFMCYLGSTLSTWFGLSVYSFYYLCKMLRNISHS